MRRKVRIYRRQVRALHKALHGMIKAWKKDPSSVMPEDWEKAVEGKAKKLGVIYGKRNPRDRWLEDVPYLNFIALYERGREKAKRARDARRRQIKKKAQATKKKVETEKQATAEAAATSIPYHDAEAMAKLIQEYENLNKQLERQMELLRRSKIHPSFVEYDTWMRAVEGTDALTTDSEIAGHVEMARRRKMGEECDGWVRGRFFGPIERKRREY